MKFTDFDILYNGIPCTLVSFADTGKDLLFLKIYKNTFSDIKDFGFSYDSSKLAYTKRISSVEFDNYEKVKRFGVVIGNNLMIMNYEGNTLELKGLDGFNVTICNIDLPKSLSSCDVDELNAFWLKVSNSVMEIRALVD